MKDAMSIRLEPDVRDEFYSLCKKAGIPPANVVAAVVTQIVRDRKIVIDIGMNEDELTVARGLEALDRIQSKAPKVPPTLDDINAMIAEARVAEGARHD